MLREAGLDAYPVLISVGTKRDPEVPDPDFNHAIVCVQLKPGDYLLMDPTDENTRALLPTGDCNQSYPGLPARGRGPQNQSRPAAGEPSDARRDNRNAHSGRFAGGKVGFGLRRRQR